MFKFFLFRIFFVFEKYIVLRKYIIKNIYLEKFEYYDAILLIIKSVLSDLENRINALFIVGCF